jgi:nicotinamidase/pyrazinamidase
MALRGALACGDYAGRTVTALLRCRSFFQKRFNCGTDFRSNAHRRHTGLAHYLEKRGFKHIYLMGLALDYWMKYSTLDAPTWIQTPSSTAPRGIELEPGDIGRALDEMKRAGAVLLKVVICSRRR